MSAATVSFSPIQHGSFVKACYAVLVDGEKIGVVTHKRVDQTSRFTAWTRNGPQDRVRRSRPYTWVGVGYVGRREIVVKRPTRAAAVEALIAALGEAGGRTAAR